MSDGRCHKPPPSSCLLQARSCKAHLFWHIKAKPGCLPDFQWTVDGVVRPGGGFMDTFSGTYDDDLACATSKIVTIRANGERVLEFVVACADCSG